jgi:hypothetical protein
MRLIVQISDFTDTINYQKLQLKDKEEKVS